MIASKRLTLIQNAFYSLCVLLVCLCGYLAELAVMPLRPHMAQKVTSADSKLIEGGITNKVADIALLTQDKLDTVISINFYGFFGLCLLASYLYYAVQEKKHYFIALLAHFICLCISYFWLSDMLYVFKKHYGLLERDTNMSVLLVATKLVIALIFITGSYVLVRSLIKNRVDKNKLVNSKTTTSE